MNKREIKITALTKIRYSVHRWFSFDVCFLYRCLHNAHAHIKPIWHGISFFMENLSFCCMNHEVNWMVFKFHTEWHNGQIIDSKCAPSNKNGNQPSNLLWIIIIIIIVASLSTLPIFFFFCSFYRWDETESSQHNSPSNWGCACSNIHHHTPSMFLSIPKVILMKHIITVIRPNVIMIQRYVCVCAYLCASRVIPLYRNAEQKEHNHQQIAWDGNNQNQINQPSHPATARTIRIVSEFLFFILFFKKT